MKSRVEAMNPELKGGTSSHERRSLKSKVPSTLNESDPPPFELERFQLNSCSGTLGLGLIKALFWFPEDSPLLQNGLPFGDY